MNEKIIGRIKKLLALSESSNNHEAQNALLKAQELLMKHKLSMQDIESLEVENVTVEEKRTNFTFTKATWKGDLAGVISDNLCCYYYFYKYYKSSIVFLGREDDVAVAEITLKYAIEFVEKESKKMAREMYKKGLSASGLQNDYALGFVSGLKQRYEEQKEKHQEWGLVLAKPKEVTEAYNNIKFSKKTSHVSKYKGNSEAYYQGEKDGKNFSISDKVATEGEEKTLMIG